MGDLAPASCRTPGMMSDPGPRVKGRIGWAGQGSRLVYPETEREGEARRLEVIEQPLADVPHACHIDRY